MANQTQRQIAANLDSDAAEAEARGYPDTAKVLRDQAANYRERTGQTTTAPTGTAPTSS